MPGAGLFTFTPPKEAPVFEPTEAEFQDPLAYIAKIKCIAEKTGICKIRPPLNWHPPFAVNVDTFKFTPRIQRLNELEARSRIKLNFLDKLARFWEVQGNRLKIPCLERKHLDLYQLHKLVQDEGGYELVCREKKWCRIGVQLDYSGTGIAASLKHHYEKILYPYDLFMAGVSTEPAKWKEFIAPTPEKFVCKRIMKRCRRTEDCSEIDYSANKELKKLQFFGPGPKAAVPTEKDSSNNTECSTEAVHIDKDNIPVVIPVQNEEAIPTVETEDKIVAVVDKLEDCKDEIKDEDKEEKPEEKKTEIMPEVNKLYDVDGDNVTFSGQSGDVSTAPFQATARNNGGTPAGYRLNYKTIRKQYPEVVEDKSSTTMNNEETFQTRPPAAKKEFQNAQEIDSFVCLVCSNGDQEEQLLLCDGCDDTYHTFCLIPPLSDVPKSEWRCPRCVAEVCHRPTAEYGFDQSKRQYSLQEFGEMADKFKCDYFSAPIQFITTDTVETEFWRLLQSLNEDIVVEYGADIHAADSGSGFPMKEKMSELSPEDRVYAESGWNLNNLPVEEGSVLRFINVDISGMKVPWCYVGMCFSSFCWHIEDHWSYSINYLHWGEPKTWYGVSGLEADKFETAMKSHAPELFEQSPDLLHHITTIMNPNILMSEGVSVVRTDQRAGEFIVTFPRSYHAGFNQGYNFAEAVNFCPASWLSYGHMCIENYALFHRYCVFSHDELVCNLASNYSKLSTESALCVLKEMERIYESEKSERKRLLELGIYNTKREIFEEHADDQRQCDVCKTTLFLSAVVCKCQPDKMICTRHVKQFCSCEGGEKSFYYRYALDELPIMLQNLQNMVKSYLEWKGKVESALSLGAGLDRDKKLTLNELQGLLQEAKSKPCNYNEDNLVCKLAEIVADAEQCSKVCRDYFVGEQRKVCCRSSAGKSHNGDGLHVSKLLLEEFEALVDIVLKLPCRIDEAVRIEMLLAQIMQFKTSAAEVLLSQQNGSIDNRNEDEVKEVVELLDFAYGVDVYLPECAKLKEVVCRKEWLRFVKECFQDPTDVDISKVQELIEAGCILDSHDDVIQAMAKLQDFLKRAETIEEMAIALLDSNNDKLLISDIKPIISEYELFKSYLPNAEELKEMYVNASDWIAKVESIHTRKFCPYFDVLEALLDKGTRMSVHLPQLSQLQSIVNAAKAWKDRTARIFLKKGSTISLLEVLLPRSSQLPINSAVPDTRNNKRYRNSGSKYHGTGRTMLNTQDNCQIFEKKVINMDKENVIDENNATNNACNSMHLNAYNVYKEMIKQEINVMKQWRDDNREKSGLADQKGVTYCVCKKESGGFMLQCELCCDWFHGACIALPKMLNIKPNSNAAALNKAVRSLKYLCGNCERGKRPKMELILSLLIALEKIPVRLTEGEALQCLTERVCKWQDRVHNALLSSYEMAHAFYNTVKSKGLQLGEKLDRRLNQSLANFNVAAQHSQKLSERMSKSNPKQHGALPIQERQQLEVSKLITQGRIKLDAESRDLLEILMFEGDLIEVMTDETKWLWQLLLLTRPNEDNNEENSSSNESDKSCDLSDDLLPRFSSFGKDVSTISPVKTARNSDLRDSTGSDSSSFDMDVAKTLTTGASRSINMQQLSSKKAAFLRNAMIRKRLQHSGLNARKFGAAVSSNNTKSGQNNKLGQGSSHRAKIAADNRKGQQPQAIGGSKKTTTTIKPQVQVKQKKSTVTKIATSAIKKVSSVNNPGQDKRQMPTTQSKRRSLEHSNNKIVSNNNNAVMKIRKSDSNSASISGSVLSASTSVKGITEGSNNKRKRNSSNPEWNDDCEADVCEQPTGKAVNWIQCDLCERWYHFRCIGVTQSQMTDNYTCPRCTSSIKQSNFSRLCETATQLLTGNDCSSPYADLRPVNTDHQTINHQHEYQQILCHSQQVANSQEQVDRVEEQNMENSLSEYEVADGVVLE